MIRALQQLFSTADEQTANPEERLNLATAALLVEVARADFTQDADEERAMLLVLSDTLNVDTEQLTALVTEAEGAVDQATSLYEFTRLINDHCDYAEKYRVIESMWRVAYADGAIDKYEEHLIRRASDLIYLNHEDFIRAKHAAASAA